MNASQLPFQKTIDELLDGEKSLSRSALRGFSDIDPASLNALLEAWPRIAPGRKRLLLDELRILSDNDTLVSFDEVARALLNDRDPQVQAGAIRLLDECTDTKLIPIFLKILSGGQDAAPRAEAASALGRFVQLGELEELPKKTQRRIEDALLQKINGEDEVSVRRRALEAVAYSSRLEVATLIESAFQREDPDWQASALFAMGRSSDERWAEDVIPKIMDENPRVQLAAIEAAGELGVTAARELLLKMLEEEENDDSVVNAAIWSLSQIGGEDARIFIESLIDQTDDDDQVGFLEQALDNLAFTEDLAQFDLLNLDVDDDLIDQEE
ncbi:MAG TPA: HEAT repeat domain-containing protein [Anaerolineales bacterium]|nr:HEAT repeat domain-containing protein [Anaerolineales bacterium]